MIAGKRVPIVGTRVSIAAPAEADFVGWAFDSTTQLPFAAALASIDSRSYVIVPYGKSRPDVAAALHCGECVNVGFTIALTGDEIRPGRHVVRLRFMAPDEKGYVDGAPVEIDVRRP